MEQVLLLIQPYLEMLLGQYGQAAQVVAIVVAVIGSARMIFKPLLELIHVIVKLTKSQSDDVLLAKAEASNLYKIAGFLFDFLLSIKLPAKK